MTCERGGGEIRPSEFSANVWVHVNFHDWRNAPHNVVIPAKDVGGVR